MADNEKSRLSDEMVDLLLSRPTLEELAAYNVPEEIDHRLHELLDKNSETTLTMAESEELDEYLWFGHIMTMAKAKARLRLREKV